MTSLLMHTNHVRSIDSIMHCLQNPAMPSCAALCARKAAQTGLWKEVNDIAVICSRTTYGSTQICWHFSWVWNSRQLQPTSGHLQIALQQWFYPPILKHLRCVYVIHVWFVMEWCDLHQWFTIHLHYVTSKIHYNIGQIPSFINDFR